MRTFTVEYLLPDDYVKRLEEITEGYRRLGLDTTIEKEFEFIMNFGSGIDIAEKFKFHENKLRVMDKTNRKGCVTDVSKSNRTDDRRKEAY